MQLFSLLKIKFQNGAHLKKRVFLTHSSHFLATRETTQKILLHISHLHKYTYLAYPIFCISNFAKIANLSCMVSLWCDSWCWFFFVPFWSNKINSKMGVTFMLECLPLIFIYTNGKFIVICKPRTLNEGRWRLSSIQKTKKKKKKRLHFVFYR